MEVPAAAPGEAVELAARCARHPGVSAVELLHMLAGALARERPVTGHRLTRSTASSQRSIVPMLPLLYMRATRPTLGMAGRRVSGTRSYSTTMLCRVRSRTKESATMLRAAVPIMNSAIDIDVPVA